MTRRETGQTWKAAMLRMAWLWIVVLISGESAMAGDYERNRKYDMLFMEAMVQRQKGNHDAVFDLLSRCREIRPDASEVYFFLAQYYDHLRMEDQALRCLETANRLNPDNTTYLEMLGQALLEVGKLDSAAVVLNRLYQEDKSRQEVLDMLYNVYMHQEAYEEAVKVLNVKEAADGKSEALSVQKSNVYTLMGDNEAALSELWQLAREYPNNLNYRTLYAGALMKDGREDEAQALLDSVIALQPSNVMAQRQLRMYYLMQQDSARADSLTRSLLLNPAVEQSDKVYILREEIAASERNGGDSTRILALFREMDAMDKPDTDLMEYEAAYMNLKKMPQDSIENVLRMMLQIAPDKAAARLQLVQYAWEREDRQTVIDLCRQARQYNPDEMAFYYYQGMSFFLEEKKDEALEAFRNGISVITPESPPAIVSSFYEILGDLLHQKGQWREAFEAYDSCLQWKEDNIGCLNNYAYYLSEMDMQLEKAEKMSFQTIKAEPKNATYIDTYAWILFKQKRYAEAEVYMRQALQNDTTDSAVLKEHGGDIFIMNGNTEEALGMWQKALEADPSNKVLRRKIKKKKYIKQ